MIIDEKEQADDIEKGTYVCPFCGYVSYRWLDIQTHMLEHIN